MSAPEKTIHIPVSAATHVAIGCVIALIAVTAFWVALQLPAELAHYRFGALTITFVAAVGAISYGLLCANHRLKFHVNDNAHAIDAARAELRTAKAQTFAKVDLLDAKLDRIAARLDELGDDVGQNHGAIKELTDAVDEASNAVEALQDCYLEEGQAPDRKEIPAPRERNL
jgi:hypothetical protein